MTICKLLKQDLNSVEYLDISLTGDTRKYVDPNLISLVAERENGKISFLAENAIRQIEIFFQKITEIHCSELVGYQKRKKLKELFSHFSEPHHLSLGYSKEGNTGKGTTSNELVKIFMKKTVRSIILNDDDLTIFQKTPLIEKFADDKLSDLTSNIIMNVIIDFNKLLLESYPDLNNYLSEESFTYYYFSIDGKWETYEFTPFIFEGKTVLLVPKLFTTYNQTTSLDLIIRVYIIEEISKLQIKNNTSERMTKKDYINKFIRGNRIEKMQHIFLNTSYESHNMFKKQLNLKANDRRNAQK